MNFLRTSMNTAPVKRPFSWMSSQGRASRKQICARFAMRIWVRRSDLDVTMKGKGRMHMDELWVFEGNPYCMITSVRFFLKPLAPPELWENCESTFRYVVAVGC